jgi:hypothetical protein
MLYKDALEIVKNLEFDKKKVICKDENGVELYLLRPSQVNKRLRNKYDLKKNFQIWLKEGSREFRPNHLRLFIDLNLRVRSNPKAKKKLLLAFDKIFYGKDPNEVIKELEDEEFEHFLNSLKIIANLAQFLMVEQEFNYNKESKFSPKNLFLQGWIREFIDSPKEIDNMCMSVARFQPPKVQYTNKENKKHREYQENLEELWYLNNS